MADLTSYHQHAEELERELRLKTFPLAIKMLAGEADVPPEAKRPLKDFGHHLSLCQVLQLARRAGQPMASLLEDNWCFEPVVGLGLAEPPEYFMQGHNRYPRDVADLEAGKNYAEEFPKLPPRKYAGLAAAPLRDTPFEPDVVVIYCDSGQLNLLLLAKEYKDGRNLQTAVSSHAACVYAIVPPMLNGQCQVAVPCRGDHYLAMAGDDEMIFSVPGKGLGDLMEGLRHVRTTGSKLPRGYMLHPEYPLPEAYEKAAKMIGYI